MTRTATEAIDSYLTDMLALEQHIERALEAQIKDFEQEYPEVVTQLRLIQATCEQHIGTLKEAADRRDGAGGSLAEAVKRAGAIVAGLGAAAVDLFRTEKLPKNLRDDFTALCLASVGYVMLATTARALNDSETAELAERHLKAYAEAIMTLHNLIPGAVVRFLQEEGLPARSDVVPGVVRTLEELWKPQTAGARS